MSNELSQDDLAAQWAASMDDDAESGAAGEAKADTEDGDDKLASEWAAALADDEQTAVQAEHKQKASLRPQAMDASFKDMTTMAKAPRNDVKRELDFILDIPLDVSAELGRTRLLINELLQLGQGSVVELNKLAGEPLEIFVNGKLVARGEAVVINEKFGVRLTDIISPIERVKQLS
jgi:flagellar motor switch protein FliN/FliY